MAHLILNVKSLIQDLFYKHRRVTRRVYTNVDECRQVTRQVETNVDECRQVTRGV